MKYVRIEVDGAPKWGVVKEGEVLTLRGNFVGRVTVSLDPAGEKVLGSADVKVDQTQWTECAVPVSGGEGVQPLYLSFAGEGAMDLYTVELRG